MLNKEQNNLRDVAERYIAKSNPWIVLVSTPNHPGDIMHQLSLESEDKCLYKRLYLPYTVAIKKMWTAEEIALQKQSPSFEREYNLKFLGLVGNIFNPQDIDFITNDPYQLSEHNPYAPTYMGIDVGFGSSQTAIVILRYQNDKLEVIHTESISRGLYEEILKHIIRLIQQFSCGKFYVDGSASHLIRSLKNSYGEYQRWDLLDDKVLENWIYSEMNEPKIVPIPFLKWHREMMKKLILCVSKRTIRIDGRYDKLIVGLRSAMAKDDNYSLDKTQSQFNDLIDALRLAIIPMRFKGD